jgi:hypothetical protein
MVDLVWSTCFLKSLLLGSVVIAVVVRMVLVVLRRMRTLGASESVEWDWWLLVGDEVLSGWIVLCLRIIGVVWGLVWCSWHWLGVILLVLVLILLNWHKSTTTMTKLGIRSSLKVLVIVQILEHQLILALLIHIICC